MSSNVQHIFQSSAINDSAVLAQTLSAAHYWDKDIWRFEREHIFFKEWHYVGHASQLQKPGDYLTTWIADASVLLVKGKDLKVRAFWNVCQHRGHPLVVEGSKGAFSSLIVCPYHAWSFSMQGDLKVARGSDDSQSFNPADFRLKELALVESHGFYFANANLQPKAIQQQLDTIFKQTAEVVGPLDNLVCYGAVQFEMRANWKVYIDNSLECNHCGPAHKTFCTQVDMKNYRSRVEEGWLSQRGPALDSRGKSSAAEYLSWYLWPTSQASILSSDKFFIIATLQVLEVEHFINIEHVFGPRDASEQEVSQAIHEAGSNITLLEDVKLCENVQRGLHSPGYRRGRYVVNEGEHFSEHLVHHFHKLLMKTYSTYQP
jgi:carnitine monooxygenase subunit